MVTKQQQVEWLAKWWHKWPRYLPFVLMSKIRDGCAISDSASSEFGYYKVTRKEWQRERDKMQKQDNSWYERGELPPVGCVCLYVISGRCTYEVEITAHTKLGICFVEVGKPFENYVSKTAGNHRFFPLRTEREKAIDEMADLISKSVFGSAKCQAEKLYDAGYRKQ